MNKILKIFLIIIGSIVAILTVIVIWFSIRYSTLTGVMNPIETGNINDTVFAIRDRYVNSFLFKTEEGYIAFDACMSEKNVDIAFKELGIDPNKVTSLFLTHSDIDHIGATGLFKNADIYLHNEEENMVNGQTARMGLRKYKWEFGEYKLLESDQVIEISGLSVELVHTPGHTPGSVCYIVNGDYLISGDNLIYTEGKYERFLKVFNMDTETQLKSLKLLPPPETFKYIMTAHNGVTRVGY